MPNSLAFNKKNFLSHLIFHPDEGATEQDRNYAWAATIILGIFTLGMTHLGAGLYQLGCYISEKYNVKEKKGNDLNQVETGTQTVAQDQGIIPASKPSSKSPDQGDLKKYEEEGKKEEETKKIPSSSTGADLIQQSSSTATPTPPTLTSPLFPPPLEVEQAKSEEAKATEANSASEVEESPGESALDFRKRIFLGSMQELVQKYEKLGERSEYASDEVLEEQLQDLKKEAEEKGISAEKLFYNKEKCLLATAAFLINPPETLRARKGITSSFGLCETKLNRLERGTPFPCGKGDEEGRFGEVAASPNEKVIPLRALNPVAIHWSQTLNSWVNETVLPCETSFDVVRSLSILSTSKTIPLSLMKEWMSINRAKIEKLASSDHLLAQLSTNHLSALGSHPECHPDLQFEVAKHLVLQNVVRAANFINDKERNFSPEQILELAKLSAQEDGYSTANNIALYIGLSDEQVFDVIKLCIQESTKALDEFDFSPFSSQQQFELAKLSAERDGEGTHVQIMDGLYPNLSNNQVLEVTKLCIKNKAFIDLRKLQKKRNFPQDQLFELAMIVMPKQSYQLLNFKKNFSPDQLFALGKIIVKNDVSNLSYTEIIKELSPDQLFELAMIGAKENTKDTISNLHNFNTNEGALTPFSPEQQFKLAKECAEHDSERTAQFIYLFKLEVSQMFEILMLCAQRDGFRTSLWIDQKSRQLSHSQINALLEECAQKPSVRELNSFEDYYRYNYPEELIKKVLESNFSFSQELLKLNKEILKSLLNQKYNRWFLSALHCENVLEKQEISWVQKRDLFTNLFQLPVCFLRENLTESLLKRPLSEETLNLIDTHHKSDSLLAKEFPLLAIPLAQLCEIGLPEEILQKAIENLSLNIDDQDCRLKDTNVQLLLLKYLNTLLSEKNLLNEEKVALFTKIVEESVTQKEGAEDPAIGLISCKVPLSEAKPDRSIAVLNEESMAKAMVDEEDRSGKAVASETLHEIKPIAEDPIPFEKAFKGNLGAFEGIVLLGDIKQLKEEANSKTLRDLFAESFQALIRIKKIENFTERYENTFGESRNPEILLALALKIKKLKIIGNELKDTKAMRDLCNFIESVIEGTYAEKRYLLDESYNTHLFTLFNQKEELLDEWKRTFELPIEELFNDPNKVEKSGFTAAITDDPIEILLSSSEPQDPLSSSQVIADDHRLLGTLLNGKNLLACVKNSKGRIVAKSVLSLFLTNDNKPILLKVSDFPQVAIPKKYKDALNLLTERKAHALGCPIVTLYRENRKGLPFMSQAISLQGPGYEYNHAQDINSSVVSGDTVFQISSNNLRLGMS